MTRSVAQPASLELTFFAHDVVSDCWANAVDGFLTARTVHDTGGLSAYLQGCVVNSCSDWARSRTMGEVFRFSRNSGAELFHFIACQRVSSRSSRQQFARRTTKATCAILTSDVTLCTSMAMASRNTPPETSRRAASPWDLFLAASQPTLCRAN
eukprot:TRINITY_DN11696_c0_g1_i6.p2 TRINITY_DN11696_c0_g1~~TRINITY_DN11696_c0_g1_i6.p2  ORF type:complete len:154 (-),score=5.76 TRINITY_DN11696_c0_g1_i6:30-491(-)